MRNQRFHKGFGGLKSLETTGLFIVSREKTSIYSLTEIEQNPKQLLYGLTLFNELHDIEFKTKIFFREF